MRNQSWTFTVHADVKNQKGVSYWITILQLNARKEYTLQTQDKYLTDTITANNMPGIQT